jgi:hypothetical protein
MEQSRNKHGPVADEAMAKEVRSTVEANRFSRAEDWREAESAAEDEPPITRQVRTHNAAGRDDSSLDRRSDLAASLPRTAFPADKARLLEHADSAHATDEVRQALESLPDGVQFGNIEQVWEQIGPQSGGPRF